ncbi:MAG: N-acetyl-gamma-glutamyl-phosphate reductase [Methanomassiliicoccus sp.]|nr:N-acetyl-gamma-glutamyl-phosphate reductase [Methanomassiliicoccus sp.]
MIKAAIVGGSGYTGSELARILCRHPEMNLVAMTSRQNAGTPVAKILPSLNGFTDLTFEAQLDADADVDLAFLATPHGASMGIAPSLLSRGIKVIDLSGDYRLGDPAVYEKWYGHPHKDLDGLAKAVYGMTELYREDIARADLVANPGCYPTCAVLSLAPLLAAGLVEDRVIIDAKSGTSGAGAEPSKATHHPACGSSITPYKIVGHRHTPEIKMALDAVSGTGNGVVFTPHLLPIVRGMLTTSYVVLKKDKSKNELQAIYDSYYAGRRFVRRVAVPSIPSTVGSNFAEVGVETADADTVVVMGALDNLVKGAAGQAVQNANIMFKMDETVGLDFPGLGV